LQFYNISDESSALILDAYNKAEGSVDNLNLPDAIFSDMGKALKTWLSGNATKIKIFWYFAKDLPLKLERIASDQCNVSVNLTSD